MDIRLQFFDGCPHWELAASRLEQAMKDAGVEAAISTETIETNEQAAELGFRGSPTILINGVDHFSDPMSPMGLSCRTYQTEDGPSGAPSVAQLLRAMAES